MMRSISLITWLTLFIGCHGFLDIYYIDTMCGSTQDLSEVQSASIETSKSLTYPNDLDCTVTFTAPTDKRFYFQINRFESEQSGGKCFDYLSIYDGESSSNPGIATNVCGELTGEPEYNTTGGSLTLKFFSDDSAQERGFAIFIIAFTPGPTCNEGEIYCANRNFCIDEATTLCDDYDHCGNGADEPDTCGEKENLEGDNLLSSIGLLVGLGVAGLAVFILLIVVIYVAHKKYKWNQYLNSLYGTKKLILSKKLQASYPLTHHYQDDEYINVTKAERDAAMVKIDDTGAEEEIPYGSSTSLASTAFSVKDVKKGSGLNDVQPSATPTFHFSNPDFRYNPTPSEAEATTGPVAPETGSEEASTGGRGDFELSADKPDGDGSAKPVQP